MSKVFLGMSGGVDSSVSAILLKEQGYDVTGVYMKNWSKDLPGMKCPWAEDLADAKRVAVQLDLDFEVWDFEEAYKQRVVDYMLSEFQKGRTPNPDIMCNEQIKFKLFYEQAIARGADYIATGHYARIGSFDDNNLSNLKNSSPDSSIRINSSHERLPRSSHQETHEHSSQLSHKETCVYSEDELLCEGIQTHEEDERVSPATAGADDAPRAKSIHPHYKNALLRAKDENKDQTYFLYRMSDAATAHTIFPVGHLLKPEVKALAARHGLDVATKKESMGVCFVGDVGMKDFLHEYLDAQPGEIREIETHNILGYHDGAIFYTIGQRHGLYVGGGLPYYVVQKDLDRNIVYVSRNLNHPALWTSQLQLENLHLRNGLTVADLAKIPTLQVRLRHRAQLIDCSIKTTGNDEQSSASDFQNSPATTGSSPTTTPPTITISPATTILLQFASPIKRPASGQSAVFYTGEICLGGGIISS